MISLQAAAAAAAAAAAEVNYDDIDALMSTQIITRSIASWLLYCFSTK